MSDADVRALLAKLKDMERRIAQLERQWRKPA